MNRRKYLKSVGSTTLVPAISVPDINSEQIPYEYLEQLFSEYTTLQFEKSCHGEGFSADWNQYPNKPNYISVQYRVFEQHKDIFTVQYTDSEPKSVRVDGLSHRKAYEFAELGRNQGLESLLSTLDTLEEERSFRYSKFVTYIIDV